ncbi:hypothetical protein CFV33872_08445 [Campylobacter fetus subsp. venerealis CCUG 33872]|uniref:Phage serine protease, peptidase S78 family n=2 Tax=Campylobacter fetus TaxID=196 RepID=A0AAE6IY36_CAMFE|nr:XkdF-like putative serine protease domain-containing protein [Campylobacter fetus]AIR80147.1 hypothetical protein, putative protease [Campylobacter fetus subsp. venerealis 97/608]EGU23671.1 hypothetical protein CFV354_0587 [Campylobacter fetus subsp. venerealis NCTC 10354]OCS25441.1 hypothetical protein CFVB10_08570 [Campylobacter fetus subsp. venerealis cfvB10]OCS27020.1 hypothetical protein CFV33872_08445 [Campylobacter fetus subsp. venerealis CCUG 33872]OCS29082.1 hypothetical protein CF
MPKRLSEIEITHISLVKEGANGKSVIYKSKEGANYQRSIKIAKSDEEKGIIYGIVYSPDEVDTQGDSASAIEIEKAAYGFMKSLNINNVDKNHDFKPEGAFVCESWIVKSGDPLFGDQKVGSWAVGIKLESDELRDAVKKGDLKALSMAGTAIKEDEESGLLKSILKGFESVLKGFNKEQIEQKGEKLGEISKMEQITKGLGEISSRLERLENLEKEVGELKNELKKSKQDTQNTQDDKSKGVL